MEKKEGQAVKELKSDLLKVKVGDWVCTAQFGWCRVRKLKDGNWPVSISTPTGFSYYTYTGLRNDNEIYPTCFPADQVPEEYLSLFGPPPAEFKDGEPVLVSNDGETWVVRVFKEYSNSKYWVYEYDGKWNYCRKWKDKPWTS